MPFGQWTTIGLRVPPKWLATCLVHWKGASIAQAQPTGTCGSLVGPPISSIRLIVLSRPSWTPSRLASSLKVPSSPPSALAPLSPTMYRTSVLSSSPEASRLSISRPIWWSVWAMYSA